MNNILITGGTGFVGSHMIDYILKHETDVKIFATKTKKKVKVNKIGFQRGDIYKTYGNNKKIKTFLNYNKFTKIDYGIEKMIEWYKKYNKINL